ncbi:hypothetical protein [Leucobacter denitrificans]|uniref:Uncharacterized protein n=1 Tax=Leucobacter denitrificans TaxID=683042 RepID=A0A7G9S6E5_9MICO|nr:hypothetical protein [Leucobacter denitrificans]QNN63420.1 hypothetical protein H9L06_03625 [Leucobacter denitrificans]
MDLKFSFGGASPDHHDHGGAPSGIPLPFAGSATAPVSTSGELDVVVRIDNSADAPLVVAEVITGDGVTYARGDVSVDPTDAAALAKATRSAISRAVAGLEGPLAESITAVELSFQTAAEVLPILGIDTESPVVTEALQARLGINTGTPIRLTA